MNWTSYKISSEISKQTLHAEKDPVPAKRGEKKDRGPQNAIKQTNWKGRRLFGTARGLQQMRKMPRRILKCHKTWFVTCKVQRDLNGSTTPKRRTATSVASLQGGELQHQNFIVSGFKLKSGCTTFSFPLSALSFLSLHPPHLFFLKKKNFGLDYVFHNTYCFLYFFPPSKKAIDVALLSPVQMRELISILPFIICHQKSADILWWVYVV